MDDTFSPQSRSSVWSETISILRLESDLRVKAFATETDAWFKSDPNIFDPKWWVFHGDKSHFVQAVKITQKKHNLHVEPRTIGSTHWSKRVPSSLV